jgi:two-component system sensor histidine kinase PilS (NtrC family)
MELAVERNERLAGIGRLAAAIAHEIRNPLASISGSVEVLRTMPGADPDSQHLIDIAVREVDRLNGLITDLLEYARPRTEERRPIELGELVGEVITAFRREPRTAEQRVDVSFRTTEAAWLEGAGGQLRQVIWNLLRNATEAMPKGGAIAIELGQERRPEDVPEVWLSVKDTGMGIAAADREHIFEPFFSTKKGGTGLGLATVARVVGDHHGEIELESEPGCGTTFHVRLPGCEAPLPSSTLLPARRN